MTTTLFWDKPIRTQKDFGIVDVLTAQTRGFMNALDTLTAFHPRESPSIQQAILARLTDFSELGTTSIPGVPEIAVIAYQTPKGERRCVVTSCLMWTGAKLRGVPFAKFMTVVSLPDEVPGVLDQMGLQKAIERMLEDELSV